MDEQKLLKNFGFNFKIERMKLKLTQDNIAEITNFSKPYISNVESGKHNLSLVNAIKFSRIVKKSVEELIQNP